jgi:hypothetical protein
MVKTRRRKAREAAKAGLLATTTDDTVIYEPPAADTVPTRPVPPGAIIAEPAKIWEPPASPRPRVSPVKPTISAELSEPPEPSSRPRLRPRVLFALDMTASRQPTIEPAKKLMDTMLRALPAGDLEMALAWHSGGKVHALSPFTTDPARLSTLAAKLQCRAGETEIAGIIRQALECDGVRVLVYAGDMCEEPAGVIEGLADKMARREIRAIVLHDTSRCGSLRGVHFSAETYDYARSVFEMLAERTGGVVLPFDISALERLAQLLEAVALLAAGGTEMLKAKEPAMPAAGELLRLLPRY